MRRVLLIAAVAVLSACPPSAPVNRIPPNQLYFPSGIAHVGSPFNNDGILFVSNGNFDRRYDNGTVVAIDLAKVGAPGHLLPEFGAKDGGGSAMLVTPLNVKPESVAQIASFGGELGLLKTDAGVRLFIPTRSENNRVYVLDSPTAGSRDQPPALHCFSPDPLDAGSSVDNDCGPTGQSLTALERTDTGIPRAPAPVGVGISASGQVWITSLQQADSPRGSLLLARGYLVRLDGFNPIVSASSFIDIGPGATSSVAVGSRYAYATGRIYLANTAAYLVRMVDTADAGTVGSDGGLVVSVFSPGLESTYTVFEGRGIALSTDERRLYFAGRSPDSLLVASIYGKDSTSPVLSVEHAIELPAGADLVTVIPRAGRSDLVAIVCSTAGVLALYDDDVGDLVAQVSGVGLQPYGIAVDLKRSTDGGADGARLYVSNFTDGQIAVIDLPDLLAPKTAQVVAFLGDSQLCLTRAAGDPCDGGTQ